MKLDSKTASFYESRPSKWLAGRKVSNNLIVTVLLPLACSMAVFEFPARDEHVSNEIRLLCHVLTSSEVVHQLTL